MSGPLWNFGSVRPRTIFRFDDELLIKLRGDHGQGFTKLTISFGQALRNGNSPTRRRTTRRRNNLLFILSDSLISLQVHAPPSNSSDSSAADALHQYKPRPFRATNAWEMFWNNPPPFLPQQMKLNGTTEKGGPNEAEDGTQRRQKRATGWMSGEKSKRKGTKRTEEAEKRGKEEAEKRGKEEAEKRGKEEAEKRGKEEAEKRGKEEAEKRGKEEAEKRGKEEAEKRKKDKDLRQ
ncbi:hypothetical protein niasHT_028031 [Heterodera trifolii]|uniref:Uncharacterized protein n=1 Tax=Heterodera trifolii TaxID=157864 RepID=A0ABD2KF30_9BILA